MPVWNANGPTSGLTSPCGFVNGTACLPTISGFIARLQRGTSGGSLPALKRQAALSTKPLSRSLARTIKKKI